MIFCRAYSKVAAYTYENHLFIDFEQRQKANPDLKTAASLAH